MQPIIESRRDEIAKLCRRFHVRRMDLFGSATRADFDDTESDVDFLVEFEPNAPMDALDQYFGLKDELEMLLERRADLVVDSAVENPYVRKSIEESREILYAA